jgi:Asp/Glu/hydantoin racemase
LSERIKVGVIRVLTTQDEELLRAHGRIIEKTFPIIETVNKCIPDQPEGIHDARTMKMAVPKVVALGQQLESEGVKAIVVSCADDPGVDKLRKILKVPVIGAGSAAAALSLVFGNKVGVLTITEEAPRAMSKVLGRHLVAAERPRGVKTTLDLMKGEGRERVFEAAERLKKKGSEVIALGCTGYSTIGMARQLEDKLGSVVVDPVIASGLFAWYAVEEMVKRRGIGG